MCTYVCASRPLNPTDESSNQPTAHSHTRTNNAHTHSHMHTQDPTIMNQKLVEMAKSDDPEIQVCAHVCVCVRVAR